MICCFYQSTWNTSSMGVKTINFKSFWKIGMVFSLRGHTLITLAHKGVVRKMVTYAVKMLTKKGTWWVKNRQKYANLIKVWHLSLLPFGFCSHVIQNFRFLIFRGVYNFFWSLVELFKILGNVLPFLIFSIFSNASIRSKCWQTYRNIFGIFQKRGAETCTFLEFRKLNKFRAK